VQKNVPFSQQRFFNQHFANINSIVSSSQPGQWCNAISIRFGTSVEARERGHLRQGIPWAKL